MWVSIIVDVDVDMCLGKAEVVNASSHKEGQRKDCRWKTQGQEASRSMDQK